MPSAAPIQYFSSRDFTTQHGVTLPEVKLAYETYGEKKEGGKVVLVSTCFGERLDEGGNPLIGEGKALDPKKYYIVRIGLMGGSESSSPSNTPAPFHGKDFPHVTYSDMVKAHLLLLKSLGVDVEKDGLHAVVGFSMGGQIAYHWGVLQGQNIGHIVCLATSAKTSQHNIAFLEGPKAALNGSGQYEPGSIGPKGFARAYCAWAMSHDWFEQRKWEDQGLKSLDDLFTNWENGMGTWDGYDLLSLARTWQTSDITIASLEPNGKPKYSDLKEALSSIACKALIMPTRTDQYFVPEDSEMECKYLKNGKLHIVETIYGHIGGGGGGTKEDNEEIDKAVRDFIEN